MYIFIFKMSWWKIKCICILTSHEFPKTFIDDDSDFMLWYCDVKEILQNLQQILHLLLYCPWKIRCNISSHNYYHNKIRVVCLNELRLQTIGDFTVILVQLRESVNDKTLLNEGGRRKCESYDKTRKVGGKEEGRLVHTHFTSVRSISRVNWGTVLRFHLSMALCAALLVQ